MAVVGAKLDRIGIVSIFLLALGTRLAFVRLLPYASGDWVLYGNVAEAILRGCGVAVAIPHVGPCVPHFGGNQLPLFPAFVAAVWTLSGHSDLAVRIVQSVLAAAATVRLAYAVGRATGSRAAFAMSGMLLALSPVQVIFAGSLLTETLALAATAWVVAELLLSLAERRLRTIPVGLAIMVAIWARMDGVLLLVPTMMTALFIHGPRNRLVAARRMAIVAVIAAAPCLLWSARNISVGLPALPRPDVLVSGRYAAPGYVAWTKTWIAGQKERGEARYFDVRDTAHFRLPDHATASPAERSEVTALIAQARSTPGVDMPPTVDAAFSRIAAARVAASTPAQRLALAAKRAWALSARWLWPWAGDVGDGRDRASVTDYYRFALIVLTVMGGLLAAKRGERASARLAALALAYLLTRIVFFALTANIELRYLVECAPLLEAAAGAGMVVIAKAGVSGIRASGSSAVPRPLVS